MTAPIAPLSTSMGPVHEASPRLPTLARRIAAASLALALGGCDGTPGDDTFPTTPSVPCSAATATATTSIAISGMQFVPYCATCAAGASVTFTNLDGVEHWVTTDSGAFDSGLLAPGLHFTQAFPTAGTVRVHDRLNPWIAGVVIVQ